MTKTDVVYVALLEWYSIEDAAPLESYQALTQNHIDYMQAAFEIARRINKSHTIDQVRGIIEAVMGRGGNSTKAAEQILRGL